MNSMKSVLVGAVLAVMMTGAVFGARDKDDLKRRAKSKRAAKSAKMAQMSVDAQVRRYAVSYGLNEADQARIKAIFLAQQKDLADFQKVRGPKIQAVDDQIAKLREEIKELEESKSVHAEAMKELKLDHQAELDKAITAQHRANRLTAYFKAEHVTSVWRSLPKEIQTALDEKCQAVAIDLVTAGKDKSPTDLKEARTRLRAQIAKIVTPEMRQAAEAKQLEDYALRGFTRCGLTEEQKARIGELCAKNTKNMVAMTQRYEQLVKDYTAARKAIYKYKGSTRFSAIRAEVVEKVLTEEQKAKLPAKYRSSGKREKSTKKTKSSDKKITGKTGA